VNEIVLVRRVLALAKRYPKFALYLIIGGSAALVDLLVFLLLFNVFGLTAVKANILSVSIATVESYTLNAVYNFKTTDRALLRFSSFAAVAGIGLFLGSSLIYLLHDELGINGNLAKISVMPFVVVMQYLLNKHVSFRTG
jgi:putative flippase GtrA